MVSHKSPLLARVSRRQGSEVRRQRTARIFRISDFGLRISKQEEGRDSFVGAAFSRDLNEQSGVTALAMTVDWLEVST
jgi:hypothetical protein